MSIGSCDTGEIMIPIHGCLRKWLGKEPQVIGGYMILCNVRQGNRGILGRTREYSRGIIGGLWVSILKGEKSGGSEYAFPRRSSCMHHSVEQIPEEAYSLG